MSTNNKGGYTADLSLVVRNHKNVAADVVIVFNNMYGDNLKMDTMEKPAKVSAMEYKWRKTLQADEVWNLKWKEDYFN